MQMSARISTKKALGLALATTLLAGIAAVSVAPAQAAAVKQGTACTTSGAKASSGATKYTCATNPLAPTSKKLVWITANCANNYSAYQVALSASTTSAGVLAQLNTALSTNKLELTTAQGALDKANAKQYFIYTDEKTKTPVNATGLPAAIAALQARLASDQAALAAATVAGDKALWATAITRRSSLIQILTHEQTILTNAVTNANANITNLTSQLTTLTGPGGGYAAAKAALTSSSKALAVACKTGL